MSNELILKAIESAKCRIYKLNFDLNGNISSHHQKKAENQKELMEITIKALERYGAIERAIERLQELEDSICNARLLIEKDIYKDKETLEQVRKLLLQELAYNNAIAIIKEEVG